MGRVGEGGSAWTLSQVVVSHRRPGFRGVISGVPVSWKSGGAISLHWDEGLSLG